MLNHVDKQYLDLLKDVLENGVIKKDRTNTGTLSVFGRMLRFDLNKGFPLLTTKKMHYHGILHELLWFLKGDTNISYLVSRGVNIWNGNAYDFYKKKVDPPHLTIDEFIDRVDKGIIILNPFGDDSTYRLGDLGPIYGKQWRKWSTGKHIPKSKSKNKENLLVLNDTDMIEIEIDQIQLVIDKLLTDPDSRRIQVNAWNVSDLHKMALVPCHYGFQLYSAEMTTIERLRLAAKMAFEKSKSKEESLFRLIESITSDNKDETKYSDTEIHKYIDGLSFFVPRRKLSLMWDQRSVDTFLGLPYNIASYATLLMILSKLTYHHYGELIASLGDVHLYSNHIEQAKVQIARESEEHLDLPNLEISYLESLGHLNDNKFKLIDYHSHKRIKAPMAV